jgi:hypothetical protein
MSGRYKAVDLGPMSMPQEEDGLLSWLEYPASRQDDIKKLNQLLRDSTNSDSDSSIPSDHCVSLGGADHLSIEHEIEAMEDLTEGLCKFGKEQNFPKKEIVNLKFRNNFLPGVSLTVLELDGCLLFEIILEDEKHTNWLMEKLAWLAREVGEQLQRRLRINIKNITDRERIIFSVDWPEGTDA